MRLRRLYHDLDALACAWTAKEASEFLNPYESTPEPVARNTAPAIAVAAAFLRERGDDPVMVVLPADHIIKDRAAFQASLSRAIDAARGGALVTFGIRPTRPDTGFGYIKASALTTQHSALRTQNSALSAALKAEIEALKGELNGAIAIGKARTGIRVQPTNNWHLTADNCRLRT